MVNTKRGLARLLGAAIAVTAAIAWPLTAFAAPANDNFSGAIAITSLPYTNTQDITGANQAFDDPYSCYNGASVWYSLTPAQSGMIAINTAGSNYPAYPSVYTGSPGSFNLIACTYSTQVQFSATANTTYYIMVGSYYSTASASLTINVSGPPANDNFANAAVVTSLPYTDGQITTLATTELSEPSPTCAYSTTGTVWYAYTSPTTAAISASASAPNIGSVGVVAYSGSSLSTLTALGCQLYGTAVTIRPTAGQTYYFQVFGAYGWTGQATFNLYLTPPPQASFAYYPADASIFDDVQFYDYSYDPGNIGFQTESWNFGDGATGSGPNPMHTYAKDGNYTVSLAVTTFDGRSASTSGTIMVKTHDVGIAKFSTPNNAKPGQTKAITVTVQSFRYPETVEVDLYSSVPGGYQFVGTLINVVPVGSNRSVNFNFSYAFTGPCTGSSSIASGTRASGTRCGDSTIGYVTFEAVATILGARDAMPANNMAISGQTTVH